MTSNNEPPKTSKQLDLFENLESNNFEHALKTQSVSQSSNNSPTNNSKFYMSIKVVSIDESEAEKVILTEEGQFGDVKALDITPAKLTKTISAFANADGGDLYIGIDEFEVDGVKQRAWRGFETPEAANGHIQPFETLFPLGADFQYEFLRTDAHPGLVLHVAIIKTRDIKIASNNIPYSATNHKQFSRKDAASRSIDIKPNKARASGNNSLSTR